jgi:hypothetical protein
MGEECTDVNTKSWLKRLNGIDYLTDLGYDGWIILKNQFKKTEYEGVEWIHLARFMKVLLNTVINVHVP